MKKLVIVMIALMTISTQAQRDNNDSKKESRTNKQKSFMQDLTPEEVAALRTKKMTLQLDLNESQQSQIMKMNLEEAKERKAKRAEREKGKERAKLSKAERLSKMNSHLDKKIAAKKKMKNILSEKQFEKWEKGHKQKGLKMKKRGERKKGERSERMENKN